MEMTDRFEKNNVVLAALDTAAEMDLSKLLPLTELFIKLPKEAPLPTSVATALHNIKNCVR